MFNPAGVFISYSHQDRFIAEVLAQRLNRVGYHTWVDFRGIVGGSEWRQSIENGLNHSLVCLILMTPESLASEYVRYEIGRAQDNRCAIVPLMVRDCRPLPELEKYQYVDFRRGIEDAFDDLHRALIFAITRMVVGEGFPQHKTESAGQKALTPPVEAVRLERPDGTMRAESLFYVKRSGDQLLERELADVGVTVVIKAPRQVGKSSMLVRGGDFALKQGKRLIFLDFQGLELQTLQDPQTFYQEFCFSIADDLGLDVDIGSLWRSGLGNTRLCTRFMQNDVLEAVDSPLVLAIDEVDRLFDCEFRSDFFGMLRSWHNKRRTGNTWSWLDLVLVISTEPYMLIENSAQSPFNVGEIITLEDFSPENVADLNARHGYPFTPDQLPTLYDLVGGHPYLVRQTLYRVAVGQVPAADILNATDHEAGIFADHLHRYLSYFQEQPALQAVMLDIIRGQTQPPADAFHKLHGAGLVRLHQGQVLPRCTLYAEYFGRKLHD
jgi:hypothetical protein